MHDETRLKQMYQVVCNAPSGNGFRVEHMPEMFTQSEIDDCMAHVHSFYEILWFQEGTGKHTVDFTEYDVKPGMIFFLTPGQIHHFDHKTGYKGVAVKMCTAMMRNMNFHTKDSTPYYIIDEKVAQMLLPIVDEMEEEAGRQGEYGNTDILRSLLCIFMTKIERYGAQGVSEQQSLLRPSRQLYIQFRNMVESEYAHLHTVQEYAYRLNVSIRTLHKSVSECSDRTPLSIINGRIMLEAKRMVRYTNMMIKEIAAELGYEDPSYFVKLFKRDTGHLPSDFRESDNVTSKQKQ